MNRFLTSFGMTCDFWWKKGGGERSGAPRRFSPPLLYQAVAGHSAAKWDSSLQSEQVSWLRLLFRYASTQKMVAPTFFLKNELFAIRSIPNLCGSLCFLRVALCNKKSHREPLGKHGVTQSKLLYQGKRIKISYEMHLISTLFKKQQNSLSSKELQPPPTPPKEGSLPPSGGLRGAAKKIM